MTPQEEWKHKVWQRWLRIKRRYPTANVSGDIMLRHNEQRTMADAIDVFDRERNKPTKLQTLLR